MGNNQDYRQKIYSQYASVFQNAGKDFDVEAARSWGRAYEIYLRDWLPINKNAAILDLGCGNGRLLYFLKSKGYQQLTGVDVSPSQVALAQQVIDKVVHDDILSFLSDKREVFDLILGIDILEHFNKDEVMRFLELSHQALKSGGRIILQTPNGDSPLVGNIFYGDFTHETCLTPSGLKNLLSLVRYERLETREAGPVIHGPVSLTRWLCWKVIRFFGTIWNMVETGTRGEGVLTRVFLASGIKK